jgi:hypothetical protein
MHLASLFATRGWFRYFGGLVQTSRKHERRHFQIFLFRATSAVLALDEMHFRARHCVSDAIPFRDQLTIQRPQIAFWAPDLFLLFHQFTPFLSSVRFIQDMLLPIVVRRLDLRVSVPQSLNDAADNLTAYKLPSPIVKILSDYWNGNGRGVRAYRILDQHYFILCRHTFLEFSPAPKLVVYLPDDPSIQNDLKTTLNKKIEALPYFTDAFNALHACVENICIELGAQPHALEEEMSMEHVGKLDSGVKQTLALWLDESAPTSALEIGQTEDSRVYARKISAKTA